MQCRSEPSSLADASAHTPCIFRAWSNIMEKKRCAICHQLFRPHPQVSTQACCSAPSCQRERRRLTQQLRRLMNAKCRAKHAQYNKDWATRHPDYSKKYRDRHPEYVEQNRRQQRIRNEKKRAAEIAKEAVSEPFSPITSGRYRISPASEGEIAKEDESIVQITVLSNDCDDSKL